MKKLLLVFIAILLVTGTFGQLAGIKTIPGDYASIKLAVSSLNTLGVGSGGVTFNIASGYTETVTTPISLTATGTVTNPIIFRKSGSGINPKITAYAGTYTPSSAIQDGIWNLVGSDYVTIDQIDLYDPNATNPATMEYGFALFKKSATDGCQHNTIKNCTITLNRINNAAATSPAMEGSRGINVVNSLVTTQTTAITPTSPAGSNSRNTFHGNFIQNCNIGIGMYGYAASAPPYTLPDIGNDVGGDSAATGNTIINFGGSTTSSNQASGIRASYQWDVNISNNTINSNNGSGVNHPGTLRGIYLVFGMGASVLSNSVAVYGSGTYSTVTGIYQSSGYGYVTDTVKITGNSVTGAYATATSGNFYGIYNDGYPYSLIIQNNAISGIPVGGTGATTGILTGTSEELTLTGNTISNLTRSGGGSIYAIDVNYGEIADFGNNNIHHFTMTGSATGFIYGIRISSGTTISIHDNTFSAFDYSGSGYGYLYGIQIGGGSIANISRNNILDFSSLGTAPAIYGIQCNYGTCNLDNNFISDLRTPATNSYSSIIGMYLAGTACNAYFNSVYLAGTSTGVQFGSSAVYGTTTSIIDLRNNILVNNTVPVGTGLAVAYRRNGTGLNNYSFTSNANCYFAGATENATHAVFFDGTTPYSMAAYQTLAGPTREGNSFRELPPFVNAVTTPYDLHLQTGITTSCESGAYPVNTPFVVSQDFNGDIRQGYTGYSGTGILPDAGADEFEGTPSYTCSTLNPGNTVSSANAICMGQTITLSMQNATIGTGIAYQWQSSSDGTNFSSIAGENNVTYTFSPASPGYYRCMVTCLNGPVSASSNPFQLTFQNHVLTTTPAGRCGTGILQLQATVSGGVLNWYIAPAGGTPVGTGSTYTTPVLSTTTNYYAGADILQGGVAVGTGASVSTGYESPFYHYYGGKKSQYLVKASELIAAGLTAGSITSLALEVVVPGTIYNSFNLKIGNTALSALTTTFVTGLTTVYSAASVIPVTGINLYTFTSPFTWNGTSNIIVETCWSNYNSGGASATVKFDATTFVSSSYFRASSTTASTLCANTTASGTMSARPRIFFNSVTPCPGYRVPVVATIATAPVLTISDNQTVCNNTAATISVNSNLSDYSAYTWSPVTNLFTDPGCTVAYVAGTSATVVFVKSSTPVSATYTCSAVNAQQCSNSAQCSVTTLPAVVTTSATPASLCLGGSSTITPNPSSGYGSANLVWQNSTDSLIFSDIPGATGTTYATPVLMDTTFYRLSVRTEGTTCINSEVAVVHASYPIVTSTTPAVRCGTGILTLGAAVSGGILSWYNAPLGGNLLSTGESYTTPLIASTTTYFAEAMAPSTITSSVGKPNTNGADGKSTMGGLVFDALVPFTLDYVYIYPVGTGNGTVTIQLQNASGTMLQSITVNLNGTVAPGVRTLVPLNFSVPAGTGLKLMLSGYSGLVTGLTRDYTLGLPSTVYPYMVPGIMSITGATSANYYYFFYDWSVTVGCRSGRTAVTATIVPPPQLTLSSGQTICSDSPALINVTSVPENFDCYVWTPATDLFTDAACNEPYISGTSADTVYLKSDMAGNHLTTCTATDTVSTCTNIVTSNITVLPESPPIIASPVSVCTSGKAILRISPDVSTGAAAFQWQSSTDGVSYSDITGATSSNYTTPDISNTTYYQLLMMDQSGNVCSQPQYMLVVDEPQISSVAPGIRCGTGSVTLGADGGGGTITWYDDVSGGVAIGSGPIFNTPVISSTTTYYVGVVNVLPVTGVVGAGALASSTFPNPFYTSSGNSHNQYLIRASELVDAGLSGGNLSSLGISITGGTTALKDLSIKMGNTGENEVTAFLAPSFTTVLSTASFTPVVGQNTFAFTTPFIWDGFSNLLIEICFGNVGSNASISSTCEADYTPYVSVIHVNKATATAGAVVCGDVSTNKITYMTRPKFTLGFSGCESPRNQVVATVATAQPISPSATPAGVCAGSPSNLYVTSGNPAYGYTWNPGNLSGAYVSVNPDTTTLFTVSALDPITGCTAQSDVTVVVLPTPTPIMVLPSAPLLPAGAIQELTASGFGTASLTWLPVTALFTDTDATIPYSGESLSTVYANPVSTITYTATATDATSLCQRTKMVTVTRLEPLTLDGQITEISCNGLSDGGLTAVTGGGLPPYAYLWSTGETVAAISGLSAGIYEVTVTDSLGSVISNGWVVENPADMNLSASVSNTSCPNADDGEINLTVSGGTPDYLFLWSHGLTTEDLVNLAPGNYQVSVTDLNGCLKTDSYIVGMNATVCATAVVSGNVLDTVCYAAIDSVTVAGGGAFFTVLSSGRATFIAGLSIRYLEGTKIYPGGYMLGKITSQTGPFCEPNKNTVNAAGPEAPISRTESDHFILYPNPTNGNFSLVQKHNHLSAKIKVEVYNMRGEKVMNETMAGQKHGFRFDGNLAGLYFVKIVSEGYVETIKLVKER